jgi:LysR family transcriptional regulator, nitrogen assimilation regulatory protein
MEEMPLSTGVGGLDIEGWAGLVMKVIVQSLLNHEKQHGTLAVITNQHFIAMDLKQLEYFVRVAELGSFTRASQALDIAQPALSRQVRMLELEFRQTLLVRNGRGALPTEAGKLLLEHARGILHQAARAREELGRVRGALAGRVAIGLPTSLARVLTVPLTRALREHLPEARFSISEGLSTTLAEGVNTGRLDVVVLYNNSAAGGDMELEPLMEEALYLVTVRPPGLPQDPPAPPATLIELAALPLVIPSRPNAIRMRVEAELAAAGLRPHIALEIDGVPAILDLVADGAGCAVLSRNAVASSVRPSLFETRPFVRPALRAQLAMGTSAVRPVTLTQQAACRLLRELVQQQVDPVEP